MCGTAQAYAWRGRGTRRVRFYERALAARPGMKEALLGLAYLDLADGDTAKSAGAVDASSAAIPTDPEVVEVPASRSARAGRHWVQVGLGGRGRLRTRTGCSTYRAEGGSGAPGAHAISASVSRIRDLDGPRRPANRTPGRPKPTSCTGSSGGQPRAGHRGELRLGAARLTDDAGNERTMGDRGISYQFPMASWTGRAAVARDPSSTRRASCDNEIDVTSLTFAASGMVSPICASRRTARLRRLLGRRIRGSQRRRRPLVRVEMAAALALAGRRSPAYLDFSEDLDNGYFDPQDLIAAVASSPLSDGYDRRCRAGSYETAVEAGASVVHAARREPPANRCWNVFGLGRLASAARVSHSSSSRSSANSSTASGPGFHSISGGMRLRCDDRGLAWASPSGFSSPRTTR